jgi:hypothetical protein
LINSKIEKKSPNKNEVKDTKTAAVLKQSVNKIAPLQSEVRTSGVRSGSLKKEQTQTGQRNSQIDSIE